MKKHVKGYILLLSFLLLAACPASAFAKGWEKENGKWCYKNSAGIKLTGWIKDGENSAGAKWYYIKPDGYMATGWVKTGGEWYYLRGNGAMATGWVKDAGKWYYLRDSNGAMLAGATMALYTFGANGALQTSYANQSRALDYTKPMIALTFDDGPSANTARILAALDKHGARATFFMVGDRVGKYSSAAAGVARQGSEIGSHTWNHKDLTTLTGADIRRQLVDTSNAIYSATGVRPIALRPSYGKYNSRVTGICKEQGHIIVNWNVDTLDWKTQNPDAIVAEIMKSAKPGGIILCHDLYGCTAEAIEKAVPQLMARGYQLVTVSELLTYTGMQPGSVYNKRK